MKSNNKNKPNNFEKAAMKYKKEHPSIFMLLLLCCFLYNFQKGQLYLKVTRTKRKRHCQPLPSSAPLNATPHVHNCEILWHGKCIRNSNNNNSIMNDVEKQQNVIWTGLVGFFFVVCCVVKLKMFLSFFFFFIFKVKSIENFFFVYFFFVFS